MTKDAKIFVAGHKGLVGSAILRNLQLKGYTNFIIRSSSELDLRNQQAVSDFFANEKPEYVFLAAAKVGGIVANNTYRAEFIHDNLAIQNNVIHQSYVHDVKKLLFLGSTCIYPRDAKQPMSEQELLTGPLEYTNEPYAIAKIAGLKMCESYNLQYGTNYIAVMPTNLYGPNDNFDLHSSHVLPALVRKIHLGKCLENNDWNAIRADFSKRPVQTTDGNASEHDITEKLNAFGLFQKDGRVEVEIWGSGKPLREFLWSEEMADACVFIMENINFDDLKGDQQEIRNCHINIGTGEELSIRKLAETIQSTVEFKGSLRFNTEKPDGTMRKLTDPSTLNRLGWKHTIQIEEGIKKLYEWYLSH
ncbi:GDP-L-fucose synthase family protein [Microbacter margulisiae]|uniref:GDP-L-fucose synthase n=1 Tax=Microbacter margulisiae TaxID=1350067 RepID=A0A7W5H080_9PORP|nr:GDP-L-fucose synthase [Microbacter margulisiae]MBB3186273.1 GDP-L-fucose synthase [Microbacter margulisiae]